MSLIHKEITITIEGRTATLSEEIYFYQNDRNFDLIFTITDAKYKFNEYSGNILVDSSADYAIVKVLKPNGEHFTSGNMLIEDNKVILTINKEFSDQIEECGVHKVQIQLWEGVVNNGNGTITKLEGAGRITIPPINITVLEPIFEDDEAQISSCKIHITDEEAD